MEPVRMMMIMMMTWKEAHLILLLAPEVLNPWGQTLSVNVDVSLTCIFRDKSTQRNPSQKQPAPINIITWSSNEWIQSQPLLNLTQGSFHLSHSENPIQSIPVETQFPLIQSMHLFPSVKLNDDLFPLVMETSEIHSWRLSIWIPFRLKSLRFQPFYSLYWMLGSSYSLLSKPHTLQTFLSLWV